MCELPETTTQALVTHIAAHNLEVKTEQEATEYLATLATVTISSRTKLLNYTTMVQHFLGTLQLPMAVYMLDYYLPMLSPNEGYNETGLTMQSAGPVRQPSQPIFVVTSRKTMAPPTKIDSHHNPSPLSFSSKAVSLATGESKADRMHSRSDIQALVKLMCSAY